MNKFQRFRKLSGSQKNNLLWAMVLLPITSAALRLLGFQRWKSMLAIAIPREIPSTPVVPEALQDARDAAKMVSAAAREGIFRAKCLEKSTVLWFLLHRKRLPAELRIGVRQAAKGFEAHAWVEVQGTIVNDTEDARQGYVPFSGNIASLGAEER
ncbi:MAG TPA: lasso peptide biosynthesis B2 protein [Candidatus Acidoferrales bacterium]